MLGKLTKQLSSFLKKLGANLRKLKLNWQPCKKKTRSLKRDSIINPPNKVSVIFIDMEHSNNILVYNLQVDSWEVTYLCHIFVYIIMKFSTSLKIGCERCEYQSLSMHQPLPIPTYEGVGWVHQRPPGTEKDPWKLYSRRSPRRTVT